MKQFRKNHLLKILSSYDESQGPLDLLLRNYFKANKSIGSKDRKEIYETIYGMIRQLGLIDSCILSPHTWEKRLDIFLEKNFLSKQKDFSLPANVRLSFPKNYYNMLKEQIGEEEANEFCRISNQQAPITLRANPLYTTRDELLHTLKENYDVSKTTFSPLGITLSSREALFSLDLFKKGYFEMQDEGSQLVALEVAAKDNEHVLDFCSGSGGKTLAFAHQMNGKGQIYLHDIRKSALQQARKRMKRANVQNYQILDDFAQFVKKKRPLFDWILLDVPCSGSGTLRRNPEQKWQFTDEMVFRLVDIQRKIFDQVLPFLKPGGRIVYATCSVFPIENQRQIDYFCSKYHLKQLKAPFQSFPVEGGMDGFFAATLTRA